jgi:HAMP domain-containing protein
MRLVGMAAAIASILVAAAADSSDALLAFVLVLATAPLFVLNRRAHEIAAPELNLEYRPPTP